ncbi:TPA: hypothetical protein ACX6R5_003542 [Photobacterium damselae]
MVLSIIISLFIFTVCCGYVIYRYNREYQDLQQQFNQIIGLRQLIFLLRFHRRESHNRLLKPTEKQLNIEQPLPESIAIQRLLLSLLGQAEHQHRPMFRLLKQRTLPILEEWPSYSIARNQAVHGKAIRHVFYLIDDLVTQALLSADQEELFKQYQLAWPMILNALDSLARFRCDIELTSKPKQHYYQSLQIQLKVIERRLKQVSLIQQHQLPSIAFDDLEYKFNQLKHSDKQPIDAQQSLYFLSQQISDFIFTLFDLMLKDIAQSLDVRMPDIAPQQQPNIFTLQSNKP